MMTVVTFLAWGAFSITCKKKYFKWLTFIRLHGKPFFDGKNGSEILKTNRKFVAEACPVMTMKQTLLSQNTSVSKDGNFPLF